MSSILKALKKIENGSPPLQTYSSLPNPIDSKQALKSNIKKRWRWRRLLSWFLILLVIGVATVILLNQRRLNIAKIVAVVSSENPTAENPAAGEVSTSNGEDATTNKTGVYRAKVPTSSAKSAQKPPTISVRPTKQANKSVPGSSDKNIQAATKTSSQRLISDSAPPATSAGTRVPEAAPNSRVEKPVKMASPPPAPPPVNRTVAKKDTRPIAPAAGDKQPVQTKPRVTYYDRIDDSKLKLQALAWSDDDARRMAVINDRIVHEGESVDGYQIIKIRREDVIVNESGKSWSLKFGLQQ